MVTKNDLTEKHGINELRRIAADRGVDYSNNATKEDIATAICGPSQRLSSPNELSMLSRGDRVEVEGASASVTRVTGGSLAGPEVELDDGRTLAPSDFGFGIAVIEGSRGLLDSRDIRRVDSVVVV
jgi:hypothetical protein